MDGSRLWCYAEKRGKTANLGDQVMKRPMNFHCRWLPVVMAVWCIGGIGSARRNTVAMAQEDSPKPKREWPWKTGDEVFQLLTVEKHSKFLVQGLPLEAKNRFKLLSRLTMRVSPFDHSLTITQKVETTKFEAADDLSKAMLIELLKDLTGKTITIRVGAGGEVARIEGVPEPQTAALNGLDVRGVMLNSLIDEDGWKELTHATLFTPPRPLSKDATWKEPLTHSWGPLGSWKGQSVYRSAEDRENLPCFAYKLILKYQPPAAAAQNQNNLPFKILRPRFRTKKAEGTLLYDPKKGRLSKMAETFHVVGQMQIQIAGQNLPLQLEESQEFQLELFDERPPPEKR